MAGPAFVAGVRRCVIRTPIAYDFRPELQALFADWLGVDGGSAARLSAKPFRYFLLRNFSLGNPSHLPRERGCPLPEGSRRNGEGFAAGRYLYALASHDYSVVAERAFGPEAPEQFLGMFVVIVLPVLLIMGVHIVGRLAARYRAESDAHSTPAVKA